MAEAYLDAQGQTNGIRKELKEKPEEKKLEENKLEVK